MSLGSALSGIWALKVGDSASFDIGQVRSWTLNADVNADKVPEPATFALVALSLAGMGAARHRKV